MSDSVKKPKSSVLLYLLLAVTVLVLLCGATIVYLAFGNRSTDEAPAGNATSSSLFLVPSTAAPSSSTSTTQKSFWTTTTPRTRPTHVVAPTVRSTTAETSTPPTSTGECFAIVVHHFDDYRII